MPRGATTKQQLRQHLATYHPEVVVGNGWSQVALERAHAALGTHEHPELTVEVTSEYTRLAGSAAARGTCSHCDKPAVALGSCACVPPCDWGVRPRLCSTHRNAHLRFHTTRKEN